MFKNCIELNLSDDIITFSLCNVKHIDITYSLMVCFMINNDITAGMRYGNTVTSLWCMLFKTKFLFGV
jgi:hypothetical protein